MFELIEQKRKYIIIIYYRKKSMKISKFKF